MTDSPIPEYLDVDKHAGLLLTVLDEIEDLTSQKKAIDTGTWAGWLSELRKAKLTAMENLREALARSPAP